MAFAPLSCRLSRAVLLLFSPLSAFSAGAQFCKTLLRYWQEVGWQLPVISTQGACRKCSHSEAACWNTTEISWLFSAPITRSGRISPFFGSGSYRALATGLFSGVVRKAPTICLWKCIVSFIFCWHCPCFTS